MDQNSVKRMEKMSPQRGSQRTNLLEKCGLNVYYAISEKIPNAQNVNGNKCSCRVDCHGVRSAHICVHQIQL